MVLGDNLQLDSAESYHNWDMWQFKMKVKLGAGKHRGALRKLLEKPS